MKLSLEDKIEKTLEQPVSKPLRAELKTHPLVYVLATFFVVGLVMSIYFGNTLLQNQIISQETQRKSLEDQNNLLRQQLESNEKQTSASTPTPVVTTPAVTTPAKPSCDKIAQERQRKFAQAIVDKVLQSKIGAEHLLGTLEKDLQNPEISATMREYYGKEITATRIRISDANTNLNNYKTVLDNVTKCKLYSESSMRSWSGLMGVSY